MGLLDGSVPKVVTHTKIRDYEDENGNIDWKAYHAAEVTNGERCRQCGGFILFQTGHPTSCNDCKGLDARLNTEDADHSKLVRCPACGQTMDTNDEMQDLYEEGEHIVYCDACDYKFEVSTRVSHIFTSPPMLSEEEQEKWGRRGDD